MTDTSEDPAYWLERAKEARDAAKQVPNQEMKDILEQIAKSYEDIAKQVEHSLQSSNSDK